MRTLRLSLAGTVILTLLGGLGGLAQAQEDAQGNTGFTLKELSCNSGFSVCQMEASDPRLSGAWSGIENCAENASPTFEVCSGPVRVENEGGTWLGWSWYSAAVAPGYYATFTVLEGEGDYVGLTAYSHFDMERMEPDAGQGVIFDFELPPFPEPPEVLAESQDEAGSPAEQPTEAAALVAIGEPSDSGARIIEIQELDERTVDLTIDSPAVGTEKVRLLLPPGFDLDADAEWPVLYLLHGADDDYTSWTRETDVADLTSSSTCSWSCPRPGSWASTPTGGTVARVARPCGRRST